MHFELQFRLKLILKVSPVLKLVNLSHSLTRSQILQRLPLHLKDPVRDLQSSQRNAIVQSLLLVVIFCTTNCTRVLARERWQTFENSWIENTIFDEHPVAATTSTPIIPNTVAYM